jgi:multiple antibiotic resistance protein
MEQQLQAIATILSLVNPLICGAMFARIETGQSRAGQLADATKASLAVLVILIVAARAGARVLQIFGVSLDAFSVAGGGVLTWIGINMLRSDPAPTPAPPRDAASKETAEERSITSIILFAASPGTITGVITLAVAHAKLELPITALVAVAVAVGVLWIAMVLMARGTAHASKSLFRETARTMMGLIVVAMGVQFALTGIRGFFEPHS